MNLKMLSLFIAAFISVVSSAAVSNGSPITSALLSKAGDSVIIPGWYLQSTQQVSNDVASLSVPGVDMSHWYRVSARGTVMAGLLENGIYNETELFFSENLNTEVDWSLFTVPWLYREQFTLTTAQDDHYFLQTNGITSKADIYINGVLIASKDHQTGSYGGQKYEVTHNLQQGENCLLITAYPTDYNLDFAMGYVDWNPYPADNGTGVWRYVEMSQTGPVSLSPPRIVTDFKDPSATQVTVTIKIDVQNNEDVPIQATLSTLVEEENGLLQIPASQSINLQAGEQRTVSMPVMIHQPKVWWPAQWGDQPLYKVSTNCSVSDVLSDISEERYFGIRHVSSYVNEHNDTAFVLNGQPFLVLGAGYSTDLFYRFDLDKKRLQFQYVLDMGLNAIRLEGKQEHPEFYDLADRMGLMILPGWECCDKWEAWSYNDEIDGVPLFSDADYSTVNVSILHEAAMMQSHPSILGFLVGSDFWPDDRATDIYVNALNRLDWTNPIIASAAKRGYPELLGPSGMKMDGPYDWVSPNYWYGGDLGAAFGFGSELGSGVGTPEIDSLRRFLSADDMQDLWMQPFKGLFHMSTNQSSFYDRSIYDDGLFSRYGNATSLDDYLLKAQVMDYEATRAEFEAYGARKNADRPATGAIYWMLSGAWPNLHWQLFDYYLKPAGAYFGTKMGSQPEHVVYDYNQSSIYMISHLLTSSGARTVSIDLIDAAGKPVVQKQVSTQAAPNSAQEVTTLPEIDQIRDAAFLRLILTDSSNAVLSRNVYWLSSHQDVLDWDNSTWYNTPVTEYSDFRSLFKMSTASVNITMFPISKQGNSTTLEVMLENSSDVPAFFIRLNLLESQGGPEVIPVYWSDNYITLWPREVLNLSVSFTSHVDQVELDVSGVNVEAQTLISLT